MPGTETAYADTRINSNRLRERAILSGEEVSLPYWHSVCCAVCRTGVCLLYTSPSPRDRG
eukprot:688956-Rhodomonas_salina.1